MSNIFREEGVTDGIEARLKGEVHIVDQRESKGMGEQKLTVHGDITWLEPLWHVRGANLVGGSTHHHGGDNHVVRDGDGLGLSGSSRREVIELQKGSGSATTKMHFNGNAYSDLGLGFVLGQERLVEEGFRVQAVTLLSELIKSLVTFGGGFVAIRDDNDPVFGKTGKLGGFQTGVEDGVMNNEQLGLGRVELVQQFVDGEGGIGRGGDSPEPVRSPGGDGELDVVGSKESDTIVVADVPAGLHDVGKTVGASSDLLEVVGPACVVVDEPWSGLRANGPVGVLVIEEELSDGHVCGDVWDSAIRGDEFLDGLLRHGDYE